MPRLLPVISTVFLLALAIFVKSAAASVASTRRDPMIRCSTRCKARQDLVHYDCGCSCGARRTRLYVYLYGMRKGVSHRIARGDCVNTASRPTVDGTKRVRVIAYDRQEDWCMTCCAMRVCVRRQDRTRQQRPQPLLLQRDLFALLRGASCVKRHRSLRVYTWRRCLRRTSLSAQHSTQHAPSSHSSTRR